MPKRKVMNGHSSSKKGVVASSSSKRQKTQASWAGPSLTQRQEKKTIDTGEIVYSVNAAAPSLTLLNGVISGDDFNNRDGRRIFMKSIFMRGSVNAQAFGAAQGMSRLIVFYDKQTNGAAPAILDVLVTATVASQLNLNNRSRFQILADQTFFFSNTGEAIREVEVFRNLNLDAQYSGVTASVASIATGSIYMLMLADFSTVDYKVSERIRFLDY